MTEHHDRISFSHESSGRLAHPYIPSINTVKDMGEGKNMRVANFQGDVREHVSADGNK